MSQEFLLDSNIRCWVFLPIVLLTFFVEIVRHYLILLFNDKVSLSTEEIQDLEMKKRVSLLLRNYKYVPLKAFEIRKGAFHPENGFKTSQRVYSSQKRSQPFLFKNQDKFFNMMKGNASNHLPMILAAAWVSYTFSGFICTKVPFPLTFSFKSMLQRNIDLAYLNSSWVSSCSWYFFNIFGLRNILNMFFEQRAETEPPDMEPFGEGIKVSFKEDFNNLQMTLYENKLERVEHSLWLE